MEKADIGVFGGSGFYQFLDNVTEIKMETPYGPPSDKVALAEIDNQKVAFLPRHGKEHSLPAHAINYRANLYAMHKLGVKRVIGPCAAGSLQPHVKPGDFVVCDQFVDRTSARKDTFYDGPLATHISSADPYCPDLRQLIVNKADDLNYSVHDKGTVVVIQGPRFSTRAESRWFTQMGWEVVNMTQYPECVLAMELEMCYVNISLITDYDAGLEGRDDIVPVSGEEVVKVFKNNNEKLRTLLFEVIGNISREGNCNCSNSLSGARIG